MTASEHDRLGVVVEGAADAIFGRPKDANPYCPRYASDAHAAWTIGWDEGRWLLETRAADECRRWLQDAA